MKAPIFLDELKKLVLTVLIIADCHANADQQEKKIFIRINNFIATLIASRHFRVYSILHKKKHPLVNFQLRK
jgi:hypothetical protein